MLDQLTIMNCSKSSRLFPALLIIATLLLPRSALPCTAFMAGSGDGLVFGRGYDWDMGQGLVVVNKRGVGKVALLTSADTQPAEWTAKYMSVTINQYGREFPNEGMNEKGLVLANLWLEGSRYPDADKRPAINELQWIQYQLDNFALLEEVLAHVDELRIASGYGEIHYFVCDATGACAAIEYLDGKLVATSGDELEVRALTNSSFQRSLAYLKRHSGFGGKKRVAHTVKSLDRFVRAASGAGRLDPGSKTHMQAFKVLDSVHVGAETQWNVVYLPKTLRIYFRTRAQRTIKYVDLGKFDPDCRTPTLILDIDARGKGDVFQRFTPYTSKTNRALVMKSLKPIADQIPKEAAQLLAEYPSHLACTLEPGALPASAGQ